MDKRQCEVEDVDGIDPDNEFHRSSPAPRRMFGYEWAGGYVAPSGYYSPEGDIDRIVSIVRNLLPSLGQARAHFADLGCGDGRVTLAVASKLQMKATGIDISPTEIESAQKQVDIMKLGQLVSFRNEDVFDADLNEFNIVYTYLLQPGLDRVLSRLVASQPPASRLIVICAAWEPTASVGLSQTDCYLDTVRKLTVWRLSTTNAD